MISLSANPPALISSLKSPSTFVMAGYCTVECRLASSSAWLCTFSATLKLSSTCRKRRFSVGTKPARKMLMPSRTLKGAVTTPYAPGLPYSAHTKSDR